MTKRIAIAATLALVSLAHAQPLTTAFTYQAELRSSGTPASGLHDLRFRLYDALSGGTQQGPTLCADNVTVSQGRFSVPLDFGAQFAGQRRFLEVELRADAGLDCTNSAGFTTLSPRQELTSAPYAAFALSSLLATNATIAGNATQLNGQPASFYSSAANLTGTLPSGVLAGTYSSPVNVSNPANIFGGSGAGLTSLNASSLASGTLSSARLPNPLAIIGSNASSILSGENSSATNSAAGMLGRSTAASGITLGVSGQCDSPDGNGIQGLHSAATGLGAGVVGMTNSSSNGTLSAGASGVLGVTTAGGLNSAGVRGVASSGAGVIGVGGTGVYGGGDTGVIGESTSTGILPTGGIFSATASATGRGVLGEGKLYGVFGTTLAVNGTGTYGESTATTGTGKGVYGKCASNAGDGVFGESTSTDTSNAAFGVHGKSAGASPNQSAGVFGESTNTTGLLIAGVRGNAASTSGAGVIGFASAATGFNYGGHFASGSTDGRGIYAYAFANSGATFGVLGQADSPGGYGVYSTGRLGASGTKSFRIDHPDDPENKYLIHYCTESPEVLNAYRGIVVLDRAGEAEVELPSYFAKVNTSPSYTLTAVGAPMPMLHVAQEIDVAALAAGAAATPAQAAPQCSFRIAGGVPGARVSWRVEAVRNDPWVRQNGAPVEIDKVDSERGTYQHPALYGQPPERATNRPARSVSPGN